MQVKRLLFAAISFLVALSVAHAQMKSKEGEAKSWAIKGDYFDACSCHYVCMCEFGAEPQSHHCEGVGAIKIKQGNYGKTSLNGLTAAFYIKPGVEWSLYVDESATEAQREAIAKIVGPKFEDAGNSLGLKTAKINFNVEGGKATLDIPGVMTAKGEQVLNNNKPITLVNSMNPLADKVTAGKASVSQFNDYGREFKYEGRNGWIGSIDSKGTSK